MWSGAGAGRVAGPVFFAGIMRAMLSGSPRTTVPLVVNDSGSGSAARLLLEPPDASRYRRLCITWAEHYNGASPVSSTRDTALPPTAV